MKTICVPCKVEYRMVKAGAAVTTMASFGPYQLFAADIFQCPSCHHRLARTALEPISEHYKPEFAAMAETYRAKDALVISYQTLQERDARDKEVAG